MTKQSVKNISMAVIYQSADKRERHFDAEFSQFSLTFY